MYQNLRKKTEGFTIIEVLIVLAIAGLIMLIVFLAVPALQRNSRNNGRNTDASRIAAAVTECLANRNSDVASCNETTEINPGTLSQFSSFTVNAFSLGSTTVPNVWYTIKCNADGSGVVGGAGPKEFVVVYQIEGSSGSLVRCISS